MQDMKKVIHGREYDTEKARVVAEQPCTYYSDPEAEAWAECPPEYGSVPEPDIINSYVLYVDEQSNFFKYSRVKESYAPYSFAEHYEEKIELLSESEAKQWLAEHHLNNTARYWRKELDGGQDEAFSDGGIREVCVRIQVIADKLVAAYGDMAGIRDIGEDLYELGKALKSDCKRSALALSGRILEATLIYYCNKYSIPLYPKGSTKHEQKNRGPTMGELLQSIKENEQSDLPYLDPGLMDQWNIINRQRLIGVHVKEHIPIPDHDQAFSVVGVLLSTIQRVFDLEVDPVKARELFEKGRENQKIFNYKKAVESFTKSVELAIDPASALLARAGCLRKMGRYEEALQDYQRVYERQLSEMAQDEMINAFETAVLCNDFELSGILGAAVIKINGNKEIQAYVMFVRCIHDDIRGNVNEVRERRLNELHEKLENPSRDLAWINTLLKMPFVTDEARVRIRARLNKFKE